MSRPSSPRFPSSPPSGSPSSPPSRRAGGRAARLALRRGRGAGASGPVRPGLEGGAFDPLGPRRCRRIHAAALELLEAVGLAGAPDSGRRAMTAFGAVAGADGRLRFPPAVVERALDLAARDITLHGRDPARDLRLSGSRVHFGTAGAAVEVVEPRARRYRAATARDLFRAARLAEALDNIHFVQRPLVCRDAPGDRALDLTTLHACVAGTTKPVGISIGLAAHVAPCLEMLHMIAGGEAAWRARPFVSASVCFVVPPMTFAPEACLALEAMVAGGMPVLLLSAGQAGATAPATLEGAVVQAVAECLAGLVYVQALRPGHPAIFGPWPFVSDLRSGAMSGGSAEQALLTAACARMGRFYGLPTGSAAGMSDSKLPDMQAGYEQAMSAVLAGLAGLNMVYEAAGMHAALLGFCPESLVIGDDLLGQALRCVGGIAEEDLSDTVAEVAATCLNGPGHYLGSPTTLARMERDYFYPLLADRSAPGEWIAAGAPDLVARAAARIEEILSAPNPAALDRALEGALRRAFPELPPAAALG